MKRRNFLFSAAATAAAAPAGKPVRFLVVTGGHIHDTTFYGIFDQPGFIAETDAHPKALARNLKDYDLLVLYDFGDTIEAREQKNLQAFVESGKGVVALHHSVADYAAWPWWYKEVTGGKYVIKQDDLGMPPSTYDHDQQLHVKVVKQHPVTAGVKDFDIADETYKGMWRAPGIDVLLTTDHPRNDAPLAWVGPWKKSRVVYIQLGHDRLAHAAPSYRRLVRNAILWVAGR